MSEFLLAATSSPISSLMSPMSTTTTKQLKPMCTVLEEQNSREDDFDLGNNSVSKSSEQIRVQVTPPREEKASINNDDVCYITFDYQQPQSYNHREDTRAKDGEDEREEDQEVELLVASSADLRVSTPTLSISSSSGYEGTSSLSQATNVDVPPSGTPLSAESAQCSSNPSSLSMPSSTTGSGDEFESDDHLKSDHSEERFGSKSSSKAIMHEHLPDWLVVGESVRISPDSKLGVIAFVGETEFAPGLWVGVVLDSPTGKNDGTVSGVTYFTCKPKFGIFVKPDKLKSDPKGRALRQAALKVNGKIK